MSASSSKERYDPRGIGDSWRVPRWPGPTDRPIRRRFRTHLVGRALAALSNRFGEAVTVVNQPGRGAPQRPPWSRRPRAVGRTVLLSTSARVPGCSGMSLEGRPSARDSADAWTHTGHNCRIAEDDRCVREVVEQPHSSA
jgi:hypothetical protein